MQIPCIIFMQGKHKFSHLIAIDIKFYALQKFCARLILSKNQKQSVYTLFRASILYSNVISQLHSAQETRVRANILSVGTGKNKGNTFKTVQI